MRAMILVVGAAVVLVVGPGFGIVHDSAAAPAFSEWSTPTSLGPVVNSASADQGPAISKDGLSLYITTNRPGGFGDNDVWVSQRESEDDPWGAPVNLGPTINTAALEGAPAFSRDGHWMFFNSNRAGGFGGFDIWASYREHVHDGFAWDGPANLGPGVNTAFDDAGAAYFENEGGSPQLYFVSTRPGGFGLNDVYMATQAPDGAWGSVVYVPSLSSAGNDIRPTIRHDGLEIFLASDRSGTLGALDLWVSTRGSTTDAWSEPANPGSVVNTAQTDSQPYLSSDRETLVFVSNRPGGSGGADLYTTTRML